MKKLTLLTLTCLFFVWNSFAQSNAEITENFRTLILEAATDFANLQEENLGTSAETNTTFFQCSLTLGAPMEAICVNTEDQTVYFSSKFEFSNTDELLTAIEILPGILEVVNEMNDSGQYIGRDYTNDENIGVTELKDLNGNYIAEIESDEAGSFLRITVFGKSWGTK
ncbi:MAG: hypothetical protein IT220_10705 [Flavobacteriaceae bacterium]|jgi:hypothetical protein|nr:hypothetical protein [Flavobacteriaceae bacterium]